MFSSKFMVDEKKLLKLWKYYLLIKYLKIPISRLYSLIGIYTVFMLCLMLLMIILRPLMNFSKLKKEKLNSIQP